VVGVVGPVTVGLAQQPITTAAVPTFSEALLRLHVEGPVLVITGGTGTATDPYEYIYQPAGRFQIWTDPLNPRGGDPTRGGDENRNIASVAVAGSFTSKVTVAVDTDPTDPTLGYYHDVNVLAAAETANSNASLLTNYWPVAPVAGSRDIIGEFRVPVAFDTNDIPTEWVRVRQILTVIGDAVQAEFIVFNTSRQRHAIGLRICVDALFGGATVQDGSAVFLPDGRVLTAETMIPDPARPSEVVPKDWVSYDDSSNPTVVVRGTMGGYEVTNPGIASSAAGPPSSIAWGQMRNVGLPSQFYFQPNPQASLTGEDWGYAVTWNPVEIAPGQSRRYVTYYGMGSSAADYDPPYAMMAYAPFGLKGTKGNDPTTPDVAEKYYYTDQLGRSAFPLAVYMDNFGTAPLLDAGARLRLPLGLELGAGETLSKTAGTIERNELKSVTWSVRATAARPGRAEVKFTGPRGKVLTRQISIPAVPILNPLPGSVNGLEMVSVPYQFSSTDAEWIFQSLGSLLPGGPATLVRYDPATGYRFFPDTFTTNVAPGLGYWLLNRNREIVELPDDATPVDDTRAYNVDLRPGWNQIGNPFLVSMRFDQVRVMPVSGGEYSMDEAVSREVLQPTLFAYDPAGNQYTWDLQLSDERMAPYSGYWVLVREAATLVFPPPSLSSPTAAMKSVAKTAPPPGPDNWRVGISVSTPGVSGTMQSLAVHAGAGPALDRYDIPRPPPTMNKSQVYLQSAFYPGESGVGMPYLLDTRGPANSRQEWNLVIQTNALNQPVTVTWPSLESLPRDLVATLADPVTGQRQYMRTTTGYTFRSGSEPTERVLKVVVQPRPAGALAVGGVSTAAAGGGNVAISYTLSAEATVDVRVRNMAGVVIGTPATGKLASAGNGLVLWSGQSDRGTRVPSGRYLCEITARSAMTGEAVSVIAPLEVRR
jgi:hypothetical protein